MTTTTAPLLLTVPQAAEALALSEYEVRRLLRLGDLRGVKHGRTWRVPATALTTWINAHTYTP